MRLSICFRWIRPAGGLGAMLLAWGMASSAQAQLNQAQLNQPQLNRGFDKTAVAFAQSAEIVKQPDLWMMEVQYKPMRMVFVDLPDQETGELRNEQIWYLTWRSIVRQVNTYEVDPAQPVNELDAFPGPRQFVPTFMLITYDDPDTEIPDQILADEVLPAAMTAIRRIERAPLKNSVGAIQDLPEPVAVDEEEDLWVYGAATWRGVDPETDFFKVILAGFTNAYEVRATGQGEEQQVWRKVIVQKYARPGDRFDPNSREFQFVGDPAWVFQPDPLPKSEVATFR